jgi:hypothetical protein
MFVEEIDLEVMEARGENYLFCPGHLEIINDL